MPSTKIIIINEKKLEELCKSVTKTVLTARIRELHERIHYFTKAAGKLGVKKDSTTSP